LEQHVREQDSWPFQLSPARWDHVWQVLQAEDRPPLPYRDEEEARALVMAVLYRALTTSTLDDLPPGAPEAAHVRAALAHWDAVGLLARLSEVLRIQLL
jgi:hypothetical protein